MAARAVTKYLADRTGDGMAVVFFEDAEAAARCAVEVSRALKSHPEISAADGIA